MLAKMKSLSRYGDHVALATALTIIIAMLSQAPPATPAGDLRAAIAPECPKSACVKTI